jgi:uncharacterized protein (DUF342 family)
MSENPKYFSVELKEGNLQAWLKVYESSVLKLEDIVLELRTMNITVGLKGEYLKKLASERFPFGQYLIAEGKMPITGENARAECLVELTPEPPEIEIENEDSRYFPVRITNVRKGEKVVRFLPPTKGTPGVTVLGKEIPAMPGKALPLPKGLNTEFLDSNNNYLIASKNGNFEWDGTKAKVEPEYTVGGDLSIVNGETIEFYGSMTVTGDVKSGVTLKVGGDLTVYGTVEDVVIECDGNVAIKGGCFGSGRGKITAMGTIDINHAYNHAISTPKDILVHREVMNCQLSAKRILASYAAICGGSVFAQNTIEVKDLGKEQFSRTTVTIAGKYQLMEMFQTMEKEIEEMTSKVKVYKDEIFKLAKEKLNSTNFPVDKEDKLTNLRLEMDIINKSFSEKREYRDKLMVELKQSVPKLVVSGFIYTNVHISINDISLLISEPQKNVTFFEKDNEIMKIKNDKL